MRFGPGPHLKGQNLMAGLTPETFDSFHELILNQEVSRSGQRSFIDGCLGGGFIGLPPVLHFARPEVRDKVVPEIVSGKKYISLAISEAFAGSDVAGLRCTAKLTPDKKFWIVNGTKKWITNGHFSDYFSVSCKPPSIIQGFDV